MHVTRVLVHNVGHHDAYFVLDADGTRVDAKPRSPFVLAAAELLLGVPLEQRTATGGWFDTPIAVPWSASERAERLQVRRDQEATLAAGVAVAGCYFPVCAAAVETWLQQGDADDRFFVFLVSNEPPAAHQRGTSTYGLAQLVASWLSQDERLLGVRAIDPLRADPFGYEGIPHWVRHGVRAAIETRRRDVVEFWEDGWLEHFQVTLSTSSGTTPVLTALHNGLRDFRPDAVHVPQARRFCGRDEQLDAFHHSFAQMTQSPAVAREDLGAIDPVLPGLVDAICAWRDAFRAQLDDDEAELRKFWLRKGRKPVLAVLAVQSNGGVRYHRSLNLEVSLPTGTLCAERNAIGTAVATNPAIHRGHLRAIAVLSLESIDTGDHSNPLAPCGACMEWLRKITEVNPDFRVVAFTDPTCSRVYVDPVT